MIRLKWRRRWKEAEEEAADLVVVASLGFKREIPIRSRHREADLAAEVVVLATIWTTSAGTEAARKPPRTATANREVPKASPQKLGRRKGWFWGRSKKRTGSWTLCDRKANPWRRNTPKGTRRARKSRKSRKNPSASSSRRS